MNDGRHPIRRAPRQSGVNRLALKLVHRRRRRETPAIIHAVHVDDCAHTFCHFSDSGDEVAAAAADQKITGASPEPVPFLPATNHPHAPPVFPQDLRAVADCGCGRMSRYMLGSDCPPAALSEVGARGCCRNGIRPRSPCAKASEIGVRLSTWYDWGGWRGRSTLALSSRQWCEP